MSPRVTLPPIGFSQATIVSKQLSPAEYDDAVARLPAAHSSHSPGDHSTGQQLLDDYERTHALPDGYEAYFATPSGKDYSLRLFVAIGAVAHRLKLFHSPTPLQPK